MSESLLNANEPTAHVPSPGHPLERREELNRMLDAMEELPETGREILVMRYLEQKSYETIAQGLAKTTHQVRALAHKALVRLRELLKEPDEAERELRNVL